MKNFLLKTRFGGLLAVFALAFGLGLTEASAQLVNPAKTIIDAKVDWVDPGDAMTRLGQEISALETLLQGAPSDPLEYKLKYYNCVYQSIEQGLAVPESIDQNYMRFVPGFTDTPDVEIPNNLSASTWEGYYTDIVNLLQK
ncbi:MAG: hypothetical protein ACKVU2_16275 [Saprospiraceae bacterium]